MAISIVYPVNSRRLRLTGRESHLILATGLTPEGFNMRLLASATWAVLFTSPAFAQVHVDNWEHGQGEPSYYRSLVHHSPELHILGAYEGTSNSAIVGVITVHVQTGTGPSVLLCSSYESVLWQFTIDPG